jgi:hypothetical protein
MEMCFPYEDRADGLRWVEPVTTEVWYGFTIVGTPPTAPWYYATTQPSNKYWLPAGYFYNAVDSLYISNFATYAALNPTDGGGLAVWCVDGAQLTAQGTWENLGTSQEIWRASNQLIKDALTQYIEAKRSVTVTYDGYRTDFTITGGCPFCGSYCYDQEEYLSTRK